MKNIISLISISLLIISCSGASKVKPLVEFTSKLSSNSEKKVKIDVDNAVSHYGNQIEFFSKNMSSVVIDDVNSKTKFDKLHLTSNGLAALPYIADNKIYHIDNIGVVGCTNLDNKKLEWKIELNPYKMKLVFATLSLYNNKLYITADSSLHVIDISSGKEIYKENMMDLVKIYPTIQSNALIIQDVSNKIFAINTENFQKIWGYETWPEHIISNILYKPISNDGTIITAFSTGQLSVLNISDGSEIWQKKLAENSNELIEFSPASPATMPMIEGENLYIASSANTISKINLKSYETTWEKKFEDVISMSHAGNVLFVTNNARQLACISKDDASVIWVSNLINPKYSSSSKIYPSDFMPPIISNDHVMVISSKGEGFKFNKFDGKFVEYFNVPGKISAIAIYNSKIILFDSKRAYSNSL